MNLKYILLCIFILSINNVGAVLVAKTSPQYNSDVNMTNVSNNILSEIIIIIPKEALTNVNTINALQFPCAKSFDSPPNQNLVFRFFKYYGYGVFSPIDNSYIIPSQCIDYQYQITWNLFLVENVDHNYDYAFGMYSADVTSGRWYYPYLNEYSNSSSYGYSWLNTSNNAPIINVSIVDMNGFYYYDNGSKLLNFPNFRVLGTLEVAPTPTPTPTGTPQAPISDPKYGSPLNNSTNLNDLYNTSNNPNALYEIPVGNETVSTIVDKINASALGYTVFGFMIFIIRFFSIKKDVN